MPTKNRTQRSKLLLVRHAQASFGTDDYDRLSPLGEQQAQRLAQWFVSHPELKFSYVASGTLRRHAQTLAAIEQAFADAGRSMPAPVQDADWNEFDYESVVRAYLAFNPQDPYLATGNSHDQRAVHTLLSSALLAWARGELDSNVAETWIAFGQRATRASARLTEAAPAGEILVVSSGGTIARCAQAALGVDDERAVKLNLALRNTAMNQFNSGDSGWQLHTWNVLPHFSHPNDREWLTYY